MGSGESQRNAVDVIGQYVGCGGDPICGGRGTCTTNSDECQCFSPNASGSLCTIGGADEDDDESSVTVSAGSPVTISAGSPVTISAGSPVTVTRDNDDDDNISVTVGLDDDDD